MNEEWPGQRLHQFAIFDREDCMIDILQGDERLNINAPDRCGRTPVYTAVSNNSIKCLEILLQHGADPSIAGGERVSFMTPLHQALLEGKEDAIKLLLRYGADLNKKDSSGHSPINLAHRISVERYIKLFDQEKERRHKNALLVVKDLCIAVEEGDLAKVKDILRLPAPSGWELANIAVPDSEDKKTPLVVAASKGDNEIMTELLNTVAIPKQSPSLIHIAIEADNIEIVKILLERFPECCISEDDRNYTPLHKACHAGSLSMVQCLMEWTYPETLYRSLYNLEENVYYQMVIHVNAKTTDGKTPLYLACEGGHEGIVEYLLNYTVKGRKGDHDKDSVYSGQSSLSDSRKSDFEMSFKPVEIGLSENETLPQRSKLNFAYNDSVVQYRPTKVHQRDNYILSSVYIAVKNQHHKVVDLLVSAGADLNCVMTKNGKENSVLLLLALENSDILMLDKLMYHKVQDVNNSVLEEAVRVKPDFIPHFLKYKSSTDTHYSINRGQMKKEYPQTSVHATRLDELASENSEYQKIYPVQSVTLRWQNIKVLNTVETSWLTCAANFNNPHMNNVNIRVPLFALTKVDVSNNSLTIMPASLLQLPSLCVLSVADNKITDFPTRQNFRLDCQCLEDLDIHCNEIETIPSYIFQLPKLRSLNATKNKLKELPPSLWQACSLKSLDLTNNKLEKLPDPVWSDDTAELDIEQHSMTLDESLSLSTQDVNQSAQELLVYSALKRSNHWSQSLVISDQNITTKKNDQKGLKVLRLNQNMISEFPEFLSCCAPFLETLDLSKNRLKCLGNLACYPMYLKTLDLSRNQISSMDDWMKTEDCGKCFCTVIPRETSGVDKSTNRPMSAMSFGGLCGHRVHTKLANLETLDLSLNAITSLCLLRSEGRKISDITSSMTSLRDKEQMEQALQGRLLFPNVVGLFIDCNRITELPGEIGELKVLRILSMKKNLLLRQLPPTLGLLEKLHRIEVEMCPIEGPIQDVIKGAANKAADITGFLRSVLEESEEYNCMNLMLVGAHNIGKTTLLENLSKKGYLPYRRTHFNQRQDDKGGRGTTQDGRPLSTVGIDISRLILDGKQGKVEFRTWDFAGQKEYYATHQYFLSPRSLYLAVWNLKDGLPGVDGLRQWLVNIQAQAPGAPVIIVGTHLDDIKTAKKGYPKDWDESMIATIRDKYMKIDSSYVGLPRVLDAINVGCYKKVMKVDKLKDLIYDRVFNLTHPERKNEKLLGHKVPKKYVELQKCLERIVKQRLEKGREPVLDSSSYLLFVMEEMNKESCNSPFRNKEDLYQATRFLHENGVLCHFADTTLKDQYFLEPQWLCDQLAKVVSIQEVQKYSNEGVMKVKDLYRVYKNSDKIGQYILGLLNKFEVAIQFDQDHLLLPSLLPTDQKLEASRMKEIPLKRQGRDLTTHHPEQIHTFGNSRFFQSTQSFPQGEMFIVCTNADKNPAMSNTRLYLLTYFPSGFWPRLITRILADHTFYEPMMKMFPFPQEIVDKCPELQKSKPSWRCWQTGIELVYFGNVIFQVKVVRSNSDYAQGMCNYDNEGVELQCFFDDAWSPLEIKDSSVLEVSFQADRITFNFGFQESVEHQHFQSVESRSIYHDERAKASILAKFVEHIDGLLQDWYPEIGESRFMQSCTGRFLVTRVILCPLCLQEESSLQNNSPETWVVFNKNSDQPRSLSVINPNTDTNSDVTSEPQTRIIYTFLVERCIKNALDGMDEVCLKHRAVSSTFMPTEDGTTRTLYLAPDLVFQDLETSIIVPDDTLEVGKKLGRGAFGIVSSGKLRRGELSYDVAVKVMFDPDDKKKVNNAQMSLETMCIAYTMARQECFILQSIEHPNIVPLLGLSRRPLALLLALAPLGALNTSLDHLYNDGLKLQSWVIKQIVVQISDALDYLHGRNIIYRDLKSDNVLVWHLPSPEEGDIQKTVLVKLADYGISRSVAHAGAKGFGGTPPFIAPEILLHAGKDIYTEKVDIFSFGMFMFELLTCRQPLKEISNPTLHVSHGGRPSITSEEADYPSHMLDLMTICWAQESCDRPSAAQVRMIANSPQFCHLSDAVTLDTKSTVLSACTVYVEEGVPGGQNAAEQEQTQCWIISQQGLNFNVEILYYNLQNKYVGYKELIQENTMLAVCRVGTSVWCLDRLGKIHSYSCRTLEKGLDYQLPVNRVTIVRSMMCYHGNKNSVGEKENNIFILLKEAGEKQTILFHLLEKDIREENGKLIAVKLSRECFCVAVIRTNERLKLWLGTTGSEILVRSVDNLVTMEDDHFLHPHLPVLSTSQNCMFICTSQSSPSNHSVWSYNYPGSKVYHWDADKEEVLSVLDCANIMPVTECMTQRPQRHDASQHQVTAISVIGKYLYVATTGGCVIVADSSTLQAFSAFRCHSNEEYYCKAILPLGPSGNSVEAFNIDPDFEAPQGENNTYHQLVKTTKPGLVTIGRGYSDLVSNVTSLEQQAIVDQEVDEDWSVIETRSVRSTGSSNPLNKTCKADTHVLSWFAEHWEYY